MLTAKLKRLTLPIMAVFHLGCASTTLTPPQVYNDSLLAAKDAIPIKLTISCDESPASLGNQYLLFFPFASIEVPSIKQFIFRIAQRELSLRGFVPILAETSGLDQEIRLEVRHLTLSAFDLIAFRRIRSEIILSGESFSAGTLSNSYTSSKQESTIRQTAFAAQLERSLNNTTTLAITEVFDQILPGKI